MKHWQQEATSCRSHKPTAKRASKQASWTNAKIKYYDTTLGNADVKESERNVPKDGNC